jgi:hypothetical protein
VSSSKIATRSTASSAASTPARASSPRLSRRRWCVRQGERRIRRSLVGQAHR